MGSLVGVQHRQASEVYELLFAEGGRPLRIVEHAQESAPRSPPTISSIKPRSMFARDAGPVALKRRVEMLARAAKQSSTDSKPSRSTTPASSIARPWVNSL